MFHYEQVSTLDVVEKAVGQYVIPLDETVVHTGAIQFIEAQRVKKDSKEKKEKNKNFFHRSIIAFCSKNFCIFLDIFSFRGVYFDTSKNIMKNSLTVLSGCSAVWLACYLGVIEVAGSSPVTPTTCISLNILPDIQLSLPIYLS